MTVKIVLFDPSPGFYAADIYLDGERAFCGKGQRTAQAAFQEALNWLKDSNIGLYL